MNPAGILLAIAGAWVIAQVFAGDALRRLNIIPRSEDSSGGRIPGVPDGVEPYLPGGSQNPFTPYLPGGDRNPIIPTF